MTAVAAAVDVAGFMVALLVAATEVAVAVAAAIAVAEGADMPTNFQKSGIAWWSGGNIQLLKCRQ